MAGDPKADQEIRRYDRSESAPAHTSPAADNENAVQSYGFQQLLEWMGNTTWLDATQGEDLEGLGQHMCDAGVDYNRPINQIPAPNASPAEMTNTERNAQLLAFNATQRDPILEGVGLQGQLPKASPGALDWFAEDLEPQVGVWHGERLNATGVDAIRANKASAVLQARATPGSGVVRQNPDLDNAWMAQRLDTQDSFTRSDMERTSRSVLQDGATFISDDGFAMEDGQFSDGVSSQDWVSEFGPGLADLPPENLEFAFGIAMRDHAFELLDSAEAGSHDQQANVGGAMVAAGRIAALREEIQQIGRTSAYRTNLSAAELDRLAKDFPTDHTTARLLAAQRELEGHYGEFSMLEGLGDARLKRIGDPDLAKGELEARGTEVRNAVEATRERLRDGGGGALTEGLDLWGSDVAVKSAMASLGIEEGSPEHAAIQAEHEAVKWDDTKASLMRAGAGMALTIGAAVGTGGASAALGGMATAIGAYDTALETENYFVDSGTHTAGQGKAGSELISDKDMNASEFALGIAGVGAIGDVGGLWKGAAGLGKGAPRLGDAADDVGEMALRKPILDHVPNRVADDVADGIDVRAVDADEFAGPTNGKGTDALGGEEADVALDESHLLQGAAQNADIDISKFDFGKHLRGMIGDAPPGMYDPHAHHVLFKVGNGPAQKELVKQGQELLRSVGIDPIFGKEVLGWAPNRVKGQHSIDALEPLVHRIQQTLQDGGGYDEIVEVLDEFKTIAAQRGPG